MWRRSGSPEPESVKSDDEGDWRFAKEWWRADSKGKRQSLCHSEHGSGVVTVISHPSSKPEASEWPKTEKWLQERYAEANGVNEQFKISGYTWELIKFNHKTPHSIVKVMTCQAGSGRGFHFGMQLPHCLATPYLKSMVSSGLSAISCSGFDLASAVHGDTPMRILNIGHGGGSLPLFLATKIKGAVVDSVEIDPAVLLFAESMGFPSFPIPSAGKATFFPPRPMEDQKAQLIEKALWKDIEGRLFVHVSDAKDFMLKTTNIYDMVFIDAYDGEDIFPSKLWEPQSPFLTALNKHLHPSHGTVVVNLQSGVDVRTPDESSPSVVQRVLPMGTHISSICQSYKNVLVGCGDGSDSIGAQGVIFTVDVPHLCNSSLVASKGFKNGGPRDAVLNTLSSKCDVLETLLDLPFPCLEYLMAGFALVD